MAERRDKCTIRMMALAAGLVVVPASQALSQDVGSVTAGQALARDVCAECHAVEPDDVVSPNLEAPAFQDVADKAGITALSLSVWFRTPHPTMPNFVFDQSDTSDISAYILSLKSN